jgi:hypothetical protein
VDASGPAEDADEGASDTYQEEDNEDDVKSLHSDALDDDSDQETTRQKNARKRKRASPVKPRRTRASSSPRKKRKNAASDEDGEEDEDEQGYDLKEGQQVVGKVVQAPKTGRGKSPWFSVFLYTVLRGVLSELIYHRSSSRSDFSKYVRLPFATQEARMQRPCMVRTFSALCFGM